MTLPTISLDDQALLKVEESIQKEWIITNGLGGYASSTVLGINTRKYHGLLVAAFRPPGGRTVCLEKLDEEVSIGSSTYPLGANEFQSGIYPKGHFFLKEFSISPFPKSVYSLQGVEVRKTIFMPYGKNASIIVYRILNNNDSSIRLRIFPLMNWRHFHSVTDRWRMPVEFVQKQDRAEVRLQSSLPVSAVALKTTSGRFQPESKWIERLYYREEAQRGESYLDDCYQPGYFETEVKGNKTETFALTAVSAIDEESAQKAMAELPVTMYDVNLLYEQELDRNEGSLNAFWNIHENLQENDELKWLILAASSFIVEGMARLEKSVIAGYHWFESWGRDTFVSLPGLILLTGKFEDARRVFLSFKNHFRKGLIPNFVDDKSGEPIYNTVDATLWFVYSVLQYLKYTGDLRFVQENLWATLQSIVDNHLKGTDFGIHVDSDGLLCHGPQLTWFDASVYGQPVNPRAGKAVEIQALWYNTLKTAELIATKLQAKREAEEYGQMAYNAENSFMGKFWNAEKNCLFDTISDDDKDASLRPNQIIAVALDFNLLDDHKSENVVDLVHREFLTPYGLRTLSREDPRYIGVYAGDRGTRDRAYHNGTVWPWLLGPFVKAFLRIKGHSEFRRDLASNFLGPLFNHQLRAAGLGTISEVFDGEPPHKPRGCIAEAWSIAEPLRAYVEDVMQIRPKFEKDYANLG